MNLNISLHKYNKPLYILTFLLIFIVFVSYKFSNYPIINFLITTYFIILYFLISYYFVYLAYNNYIKNKNKNNRIMTYKILNTLIKFISVAISIFVIISKFGISNTQNSVLISMGLYIIYTFMETKIILKINQLK